MNEYKNHDHDEGPRYDPSTGHPSFGGWPIAITEPMLTHLGHVQALYEFALQQPRWNLAHSESTRLGFFSAAVQAASGNSPGRLFTKLVKDRAWLNLDGRGGISKQSEERARKGLQKLDRPPVLPAPATVQLAESIEQRHTESQINDTTKGASNVQ